MITKLKQYLLEARKAKVDSIKNVLSILIADIELKKTDPVQMIQKYIKNSQSNFDLTGDTKYKEEVQYLKSLLPEQLTAEEIKTICSECNKKKAIVNAKFNSTGKIVTSGETIEIGGNEKYRPLCRKCYNKLK